MELPILRYFELQNWQFHETQQVSMDFFLLKSYFRDSMRSQGDSSRAADIHGHLPPIHARQRYTIHFLNSSRTLSFTVRDSSTLRQPPGQSEDGRIVRRNPPTPSRADPAPQPPLPEFRSPLPSRPQPRWRRGRSQRGRLGAGPRRPVGAEGRCQAGGCPGVRLSGPSANPEPVDRPPAPRRRHEVSGSRPVPRWREGLGQYPPLAGRPAGGGR